MLRKVILVGLVGALLTGLVAMAQAPVTVEFWHRFSESRVPYLEQLSTWFEEENPGIDIEWVYQGSYSALQQKINGAVVAGEVPSMTIFYENWIPAIEDALLPLGPYFTAEEIADINPALLYPDVLTVPFNKSIMVLYYIEDYIPEPPTTWEEYYDLAVANTVDEDGDGVIDRYGTGFRPYANPEQFLCLLAQNDGSILNDDWTEVTLGNEAGREALEFYASLAPYSWVTSEYLNNNIGYVAMAIDTSAGAPYWIDGGKAAGLTVKTAPLPAHKKAASMIQGTNIGVFKDNPQAEVDAAIAFTKFLLRPEMTGYWAAVSGYMPVTLSGLDSAVWKYKESTDDTVAASTTMMEVGVAQSLHPNYGDMRDNVLTTLCDEVMRGSMTVDEALAVAIPELEALLNY